MNKNKLSRFLLSTSVGIFTALGISEVSALDSALGTTVAEGESAQTAAAEVHTKNATAYLLQQNKDMTEAKARNLAKSVVETTSGLSTLNVLDTESLKLFEHFKDILNGNIQLTPEHFDSFLSQIADASTLKALGVDSVRDLKSPEAERLVVPAQITTVKDAVYFAEQRKDAGEFEVSAQFFLKARDLTETTNTTLRTEYAEKALLMYSEHFIHHVARVSSVTEANVTAAQTLLASVKALAESTNTDKAFLRAASCAEELGTAIYDLALKQTAARDKLTDTTAQTAEDVKIAKVYVSLYNADIVARDMHEKAAAKKSGQDKNLEFAAAAESMRLAIGALADAYSRSSTAVFSGDVTVATKLNDDAVAFKTMYTELASTSGVVASEALKTSAVTAKILLSKLKATWNARSSFDAATAQGIALNTQYTDVSTLITEALTTANTQYSNITAAEQYLSARDIAVVRSVRAEQLYRVVLDLAAVASIVEANVTTAVTDLKDYVDGSNSSVKNVVDGLDQALKSTLDEVKAAAIRSARTDCNRTLSGSYALIAKAASKQLEKISTAALGGTLVKRAEWLDNYLKYARLANNKAAWEAGVTAIDVVLAVADVALAAADDARLVKALALTAKAEALLKRNTAADDELVAKVDATTGALATGLLFDADAVATAMAAGASRITARDHLRKAFESAVELHNNAAVKQGLRTVWATVENLYAVDKLTVTDTALSAAIATNSSLQQQNGDTWTAILDCFAAGATAEAVKNAIRTALLGTNNIAAGDGIIHGSNDTHLNRRAALVANTLAKYFNDKDVAIDPAFAAATPADHAWFTVEGLFNDLKKEFDRITALSTTPYSGYKDAAAAFDKARTAKADWAKAEVDGLSSVAVSATWTTKRDAAGAAYTAAADYEIKRAGALLSAAGIGDSTSYATLADIAAMTSDLATVYVTEDVLDSLHRRAVSLKNSADTYNRAFPASGANAAVAANTASRDTAIESAVEDSTGAAVAEGAYEIALGLVNKAYQGVAGFNAAAPLGTFVGERLAAITAAYRKVNAAWLSDLTATLTLATTGTDAVDHRAALRDLVQDAGAIDGAVTTNIADCIYSVGALFDTGAGYDETHSAYRGITLGYETVLKTLAALGTTALNLEAHQEHVYDALKENAELAKAIPLTDYTAATPATTQQMKDVITQLTERADLAEAVVSAAYGALRLKASQTDKSFKAARAQAITEMTGLIQEGAMDFADTVLKEENNVATADLKAKVAHQLGRLLVAKAASERIRFDNLGAAADKANALTWYLEAVNAYKKEIAAILSQTDAALMAGRNSRLADAYENLAEAYKQAIANGADAALVKEQYTAVFNQAQILYREGSLDRSAKMLEDLSKTDGAAVVHGSIMRELAEQYEAAGKFLKAANVYKASTQNHVAQKDAAAAYEAAENALKAAQQVGHSEACLAAAEAFNLIGATAGFHGRVRAEAYQQAAGAYILGEMYEEASVAYSASGSEWAKIGDHMQAGNQYEKAAWALSKIASVTVDQRIEIIQAIEKAAHQLQIADATSRLEKLVGLAEEQITVIKEGADSIANGKLKAAVISAAGAMYEKALAFQKEGDLSHAEAAQARIEALVRIVDAGGKEAGIHLNVAKLYSLQKKHALAADTYVKAAESFVEGDKLLDAANAYADAADAVLAASQGSRIKDSILPALLDISASVRAGGSKSGRLDQFEIHLAVVEVYRDLAKLNPSELDNALAEVEAILAEAPTQKDVQARIAGVKIGLLSQKVTTLKSDDAKAALLQQAQAAFDAVKGLTGETTISTVSVKRYVAVAANALAKLYELSRVIHATNGLVYLDALRSVIEVAEAAATAAYDAAAKVKTSYDVALEATKVAARAMESYTKGMIHYVASEKDKARTDDMVYLRGIPDRMTKLVENAVRETLLGILKSREEAAVIQSNFVEVLDASNKVSTYIVGLRNSETAHDSHGNAAKTTELKATMATTATAVKGASGDLKDQAAAAQALAPVARAAATDELVSTKTAAVVAAVSTGVKTQAALVTGVPAASVAGTELYNHAQGLVDTVLGDGKATGGNTKGLVGDLQSAQSGPTTSANAVISPRN
ncbi:hypothetical protein [Candidatus Bodocaedibacter vickermanii]|uniref:Uncharacterized protein n=1 Tax=Candidatus Bodocaedibacter vickermanii TaxID=2741701 RepID=A0A7L9RUL0_9PROT|nr:hypothetical protein CPBP_01025 [Candidatus Paracaedibacteraceae bacterium 'Lake Konstanz']